MKTITCASCRPSLWFCLSSSYYTPCRFHPYKAPLRVLHRRFQPAFEKGFPHSMMISSLLEMTCQTARPAKSSASNRRWEQWARMAEATHRGTVNVTTPSEAWQESLGLRVSTSPKKWGHHNLAQWLLSNTGRVVKKCRTLGHIPRDPRHHLQSQEVFLRALHTRGVI